MSPNICLWLAAVVCLLPLKLMGRKWLKDPFNPILFVGLVSFFLVCYRPLHGIALSLEFVSAGTLAYFFLVVAGSVLAFYIGYWLHWQRNANLPSLPSSDVTYSAGKLLALAALFTFVGLASYLGTRKDYGASGYIRDFANLWVAGVILSLQAALLDKRYRPLAIFVIALALIHPLDRIVIYGQRGDTFRLAVLTMPFFLFYGIRPARKYYIPGALFLALVIAALPYTRSDETSGILGRFQALARVMTSGDILTETKYSGSEEHVYGAATVQAVRDNGLYNHGRFLVDIVVRFLPKELFEKDSLYSPWSRTNAVTTTGRNAGYRLPLGSFPTGFALVFVEFGWAAVFFWGALGYSLRRLYIRASSTDRVASQGYYTAIFICLLYLLSQDLMDFVMNIIYVVGPLMCAYWYARVRFAIGEETLSPALMPELQV